MALSSGGQVAPEEMVDLFPSVLCSFRAERRAVHAEKSVPCSRVRMELVGFPMLDKKLFEYGHLLG
jgi:hypothetical protein